METNDREYALVFQGQVAEGQEMEEVKARFTESMRCDPAKTEALFSGRRLIIKCFPAREAAEQGAERLRRLGMVMEVIVVKKKEDTPATPAPIQAATASSSPVPLSVQPPAVDVPDAQEKEAEAPPKPPAPKMAAERRAPFVFSGSGSEFFKIWIVNVFLSILTLGIWSAWAKVRTMRYFYGNTTLDGSAFEYLAEPVKILKGRLLVFGVFAAFSAVSQFYPLISPIGGLILLLLTPWIVRQSLRFQRHYTVWRGVRFAFAGTLRGAVESFALWPIVTGIIFFILHMTWHRQTHYLIDHSRYGSASFTNHSTESDFFRCFWHLALFALPLFVAVALVLFMPFIQVSSGGAILSVLVQQALVLISAALAWIIMFALYKVRMVNLRLGKTEIGPHRIVTSYASGSYLRLVLTNTLGIILTLGMYYPFAKVRTARYAAEHTEMIIQGDLDDFVATHQAGVSALGGEAADFFDMDIGF